MKKFAFYILLSFFLRSFMTLAQDSIAIKNNRKFLYGINVSASMSTYMEDNADFSAVITSNTKYRHSVYLGPLLNGFSYGRNKLGMQGGYKFFPNVKQKRFDFYFFYDQKYMKALKFFYINPHPPLYLEASYWQHIIGYGFHFNIIPNFYINHNFGIGIIMVKTKIYPRDNITSGLLNIGLGYNF